MPATATAPARARTRPRPATTRFVPVAVGRTAVAVGGFADSGLMVRLTRGRLWIGLLAGLLIGIVGLNVVALSFSARSSEAARKAEALEQRNSALRAQLASQLTTEELQAAASRLGLVNPQPGSIGYLKPSPEDAAAAAKRLRSGELATADSAPVVPVVADAVASTTPTDPAVVAAEPAVEEPVVTGTPTEPTVTETPAVEATPDPAATSGGAVVAP